MEDESDYGDNATKTANVRFVYLQQPLILPKSTENKF